MSNQVLTKIHYLSQVPVITEFNFNDTKLGTGTSFMYKKDKKLYLVSTWHNFSGRNPDNGRTLSDSAGIPNKIKCNLILNQQILDWSYHIFNINDKDENPLWLEHPILKEKIDVGILPIELPKKYKEISINNYSFSDIRIEISAEVFILGFPQGIYGRKKLPIWKRGSIASEPGGKYPIILIDTATREGMSGSPVIVKHRGIYFQEPGKISEQDWFGEGELFLGVYSGRIGEDIFKAQLGKVWKKEVIDEIINGKKRYKD